MTRIKSRPDQEFLLKLGKKISSLRKERGMSQNDLAYECGWDKPNLREIENGRTNPTTRTLLKLAKAMNLKVKDLFSFE